jgi:hypothetical protein
MEIHLVGSDMKHMDGHDPACVHFIDSNIY